MRVSDFGVIRRVCYQRSGLGLITSLISTPGCARELFHNRFLTGVLQTMPSSTTAVAHKSATFNPKSFQRDFTALAVQNPKKAANMAGDWRLRLENALIEAETATEMALQLATIGGSNLAFSTLTGWFGAKKEHIEEQWFQPSLTGDQYQKKSAEWRAANATATPAEIAASSPFKEGGFKDPTKMVGIPMSLWYVGGTGLLAWFARNTEQGVLARGLATGALTNMTGELGSNAGRKMFKKNSEKAADDS